MAKTPDMGESGSDLRPTAKGTEETCVDYVVAKNKPDGLSLWFQQGRNQIKVMVGTGVTSTIAYALSSGQGDAIRGSFSASPGGVIAVGLMFVACVAVVAVAVVYVVKNVTRGPEA